jgi:hypothetical protein
MNKKLTFKDNPILPTNLPGPSNPFDGPGGLVTINATRWFGHYQRDHQTRLMVQVNWLAGLGCL